MTTQEYNMLKLFIDKPFAFSDFQNKYVTNIHEKNTLLSLSEKEYIDFNTKTDMLSISLKGSIAYQRHIGERRDSFRDWLNRSFLMGTISGIIIGVASTLLVQYLLNLLDIMP